MFDDFPVVINYGKLSALFHVGRPRLIEMMGITSFFFNLLLEQLLKFVLSIELKLGIWILLHVRNIA